jgi:hypothetical protein
VGPCHPLVARILCIATQIALLAAANCGGQIAPSDSLDAGASSGPSATANNAAGVELSLDNVCDTFLPVAESEALNCCTPIGLKLDPKWVDLLKQDCAASVAAARSGTTSFHPERAHDCFLRSAPNDSRCFRLNGAKNVVAFNALFLTKCNVFEGTKRPGEACGSTGDCAQTGAGVFCRIGTCTEAVFSCGTTECSYPGPGESCDAMGRCDPYGSYCASGRCAPQKAAGQTCSGRMECEQLMPCTDGHCTATVEPGDLCVAP